MSGCDDKLELSVEDIDRARRWLTRFVKQQDVALINALCDKALLGALSEIPSAHSAGVHRFSNVSCSQCGRDFGPGDHGFSHCSEHAAPTPTVENRLVYLIEKGSPAQYFAGFDYGAGKWTPDFASAMHFKSRADAQRLWNADPSIFTIFNDNVRIEEHMDCAGPDLTQSHVGDRSAAQLAFDQQSDDPQPGDWNDACRHIAGLLQSASEDTEAAETMKRLRSLIPGCECSDPLQCWEPCGTLGHSEKHARVAPADRGKA